MPGGHEHERGERAECRRRPSRRGFDEPCRSVSSSSSSQLPRRTQRGQNKAPRSVQAGRSRHEARCSSHFSMYLRTDGFSGRLVPATSSRRLRSTWRIRSSYSWALNDDRATPTPTSCIHCSTTNTTSHSLYTAWSHYASCPSAACLSLRVDMSAPQVEFFVSADYYTIYIYIFIHHKW